MHTTGILIRGERDRLKYNIKATSTLAELMGNMPGGTTDSRKSKDPARNLSMDRGDSRPQMSCNLHNRELLDAATIHDLLDSSKPKSGYLAKDGSIIGVAFERAHPVLR